MIAENEKEEEERDDDAGVGGDLDKPTENSWDADMRVDFLTR